MLACRGCRPRQPAQQGKKTVKEISGENGSEARIRRRLFLIDFSRRAAEGGSPYVLFRTSS